MRARACASNAAHVSVYACALADLCGLAYMPAGACAYDHYYAAQRWNLREFTASCKVVPLGRVTFWMLKLVNFHRCPCCPYDIKVP